MADQLTKEQLEDYKEAFTLFNQDGTITASLLGTIMRSLGHNPTVEELENMMREIPPNLEATAGAEARVDFPEFLTIMARRGPSTIHEGKTEIIEAFHVFDKEDTGVVSAPDLLKALTKFGFKLEEHEVEEMFRISNCVDNNGQIKYKELVEQYF